MFPNTPYQISLFQESHHGIVASGNLLRVESLFLSPSSIIGMVCVAVMAPSYVIRIV
ncbi:hypothetical protein BDV38DRAFT_249786 [Aspergillus pseudotamarii]|uniref:Uncharacterized protein n=1 Tax=Aspergillus pseudotamarii TaxID=132259 RepID=A0A5N6SNM8_ASPPS|nr:uncharacterized protein BDV38DRAFT_249786 [Aspergillus pseudotamarii]KAE8136288.1 hypothetical protein BDV38DRAFT_249786 [Aspergillus pseudotamarii]